MQQNKAIQLISLLIFSTLLVACGSQPRIPPPPGTSRIDIPVTAPAAPPASAEPYSPRGNRSPYQVFGQTYYVLPTAQGYQAEGTASWYGEQFHGLQTSNGEIYNMYALTAAHKSLPIPCYARITHLGNGRQVVVRVNDRGPFHDDRLIDLSYGAALQLGFADVGLAQVRIEVINASATPLSPAAAVVASTPKPTKVSAENGVPAVIKRKPPGSTTAARSAAEAGAGLYLQAGAFSRREAAAAMVERLTDVVKHPISISTADTAKRESLFRVRIGPIASQDEAQQIQSLISRHGIASSFAFRQ